MYERISLLLGRVMTLSLDDLRRENGQTVTEYGIVLGVLIVALAATVIVLNDGISAFLTKVTSKISSLIT